MKPLIFLVLLFIVTTTLGQNENSDGGIKFTKYQTWQQIQAKAAKENKYVFVDAYATWCVPCKQMDSKVYARPDVGAFVNDRFISVKLQFDTTLKDDDEVKSWHQTASDLNKKYAIVEFPTLLFFSPDGKLVHRAAGYKPDENFLHITAEALDPKKQAYTLLNNYLNGVHNYRDMESTAMFCKLILKDNKTALNIAHDYMTGYLFKLPESKRFGDSTLAFISKYADSSGDIGFKFVYDNQSKFRSYLEKKYNLLDYLDWVIFQENIRPVLIKQRETPGKPDPNWDQLVQSITKKYNSDFSNRAILQSKVIWYEIKEDWASVVQYSIEKVEKYGAEGGFGENYNLNHIAWDYILTHSDDPVAIGKAINWMEKVIAKEAASYYIDTYANLLYKSGKKAEAIQWEQKALQIAQEKKEDRYSNAFASTLDKMQKGELTWH